MACRANLSTEWTSILHQPLIPCHKHPQDDAAFPRFKMAPPNVTFDDNPLPSARHYPLNIDLPFELYEHRRVVARDILVNRVMSKLLFPGSKGLAQAYDTHRSHENGLHNFAPIKRHDKSLARDLELLRKMLTTCSITDDHTEHPYTSAHPKVLTSTGLLQAGAPRKTWHVPVEEEGKVAVTVGDEIKDLVRRHYLETDDPCLRIWLQTIRPPSLSSYNTLSTGSRAEHTHSAAAQRRRRHDATQTAGDEKKWYKEDIQHLAAIQTKMREARLPPLHDGGVFLPQLRLRMFSSKAARVDYLTSSTDIGQDILFLHHDSFRDRIMDVVYPWPEGQAPRRVLTAPSCGSRSKKQWRKAMESSPPVDFSSEAAGRVPGRNGVWSTGGGVVERGRSARRPRRRATSEPPHGMFTSARLPRSFNRLKGTLIFPQMKLDTMYQRSRRRSLSRTRVAEMFDWKTRSRQEYEQERRHKEAQHDGQHGSWHTPLTHEYSTRLHALNECVEQSILLYEIDVEKVEWAELNRMLGWVLGEADGHESGQRPCPNCAARHLTCPEPCGFCGAPSPGSSCIFSALSLSQHTGFARIPSQEYSQHGNLHIATDCPVAKQNRCKCGPFPQYHVAAKCAVLCSRDCGNMHPPGHFKHKNAMTCKSRCCMCGIQGHSGSQCKLKRCRCGGAHLGQDCTWKVECRVEGCDRFLCGLHCWGCGMSREHLDEGSRFEGHKCPACLGRTSLVDDVVSQSTEGGEEEAEGTPGTDIARDGTRRGRRRNHRKTRGTKPKVEKKEKEAEFPWYTPLQPRTRPIVMSKSGKRNAWKGAANGR